MGNLIEKVGDPEPEKKSRHVDDFIDWGLPTESGWSKDKNVRYARFWLQNFRFSALLRSVFREFWLDQNKLFATYEGKRYRVIGCSRMGDVWITSDFSKENGYEHRVMVDDLSNWSPIP